MRYGSIRYIYIHPKSSTLLATPLTESQKIHILDLHYAGNSNDEIHNITKISTGSISSVITNHTRSLDSQDHDSIITVCRSWLKNNMSLGDASIAIITKNSLKKNGFELSDLSELSKILSYVGEKKITSFEFVDFAKQLMDLQKKSDIHLCDVPQKISDIQDKYESLKEKSAKLEKDIKLQEKSLQESIESKNTTIKQDVISILESFEFVDYI